MSINSKISIALATYNGEKFISEQLDSILSQTFNNWELIISDDGSNDNTLSIIQKYVALDSRIHFVENKTRHGCAGNFENALNYCKGEYIAFCDQDDVWTEDHLEYLLSIIGDKSLAFADAEAVNVDLKSLKFFLGEKFFITKENLQKNLLLHLCFLNFVQGTAVLFKRELLDFLPFPNILYHDHWVALSAVLKNGIVYSSKSILKYRQHENNTCGVMNHSLIYKIKHLYSEGIRRIKYFYTISDFVHFHENLLTEKNNINVKKSLFIAESILFNRNFQEFKNYYDVIFWDNNKKKLLSRYLMYSMFFPLIRKKRK